jgi:nicotinamide-nucleotide amidase
MDRRVHDKSIDVLMREKGLLLSVAESCTGGLIGNLITNVPGSSLYYLGGIIVYSNKSKVEILKVPAGIIEEYGAVSDQTAREMAEGVKRLFGSHLGLAVTGIAGPGGGSEEKPVGTVFIGLAVSEETFSGRYLFQGTRMQVKEKSAETALEWVRRYLNGDSFVPGL